MNTFQTLIDKSRGKISLGGPKRRWENSVILDLKNVSIQGIGLIRLWLGIIGETFVCGIESMGYIIHVFQ